MAVFGGPGSLVWRVRVMVRHEWSMEIRNELACLVRCILSYHNFISPYSWSYKESLAN